MKRLQKPRFLFVYPLVVWLFLVARISKRTLRWGGLIILIGEVLRCWANGYVGTMKVNETTADGRRPKIGRLITGGPYAYVRHPLYLGTLLIGMGFCVVVGNPWALLVTLAGFLLIYRAKMASEEETIRHEWGAAFARYQQAVPRWLPGWRRYADRYGRWTWAGIAASKEWKTLAWLIIALIALYLREEVIQEGEALLGEPKHVLLLGVAAALLAADGVAELLRRWKRSDAPPSTAVTG